MRFHLAAIALLVVGSGGCSEAPDTADSNAPLSSSEKVSYPGVYRGYSEPSYDGHVVTSEYVAMRDGTRIAIDVFRPTENGVATEDKLPVLWMHTPYNRRYFREGALTAASYPGKALELAAYGYVIAVADFRGLYASFGSNAGFNRGEWQDAARMDAYDITEWLASRPWSSGKIGMWGCSATGGSQMQALTVPPPSLKAVFPMSCEWDVYPFANFGGMAPPDGIPTRLPRGPSREERDSAAVPVDGDDDRVLLEAAIAEHASNVETAGFAPYRDSVAQNFDAVWWQKSSPASYEDAIERAGVAIYLAANLDEEGAGYGPPFTFRNLSNPRKLVIGPATHCDWTTVRTETGFDILIEELRFYDHWLKGIDNGVMKEAPVTYYTYNLERTNIDSPGWQTAPTWPLPNEQRTAFHLGANTLSTASPTESGTVEAMVDYDVTNADFWDKGMQFVTAPLDSDMQVTGHPVLRLWLSSSAIDADVVARIDDLSPDGTATYRTVEGRLRASMRALADAPYDNLELPYHPFTQASMQPLEPGEAVPLEFDFYVMSSVFRKGHRIRLTLNFADPRSTPRIEPIPLVKVHHGGTTDSVLVLPVIPE